ncbi:MAG: FAD-dependent oxidoreductase [Alphaproteobacteria bacterium]|nr:FAD-dependent oxidoreductase [Alphaproteobacteria bacterium]
MGAAWLLSQRHRVTLYEREGRFGGHSNTVDVPCGDRVTPVDTGFIVYNERNYPNLTRLFRHLEVETRPSDMSFAVSIDRGRLEYNAGTFAGLFAQPANALRPSYWRMLAQVLRFFREAGTVLEAPGEGPSLGDWLAAQGYGRAFIADHLLPMGAAIWSVPAQEMLAFPARSFVQFFRNHGLLEIVDRPRWRTVVGGSRAYVAKITAALSRTARLSSRVVALRPVGSGVLVVDRSGTARRFDQVVVATHADEALAMLDAPTDAEARVLGAFRYQRNLAVLHRDRALMPRRRAAWGAWNYLAERRGGDALDRALSVTYWMNRLQDVDPRSPLFVTLNPIRAPRDDLTVASFEYDHPAYDAAALAAQRQLPFIQGERRIWFCGSYCGYGFHEDALAAGLDVAERFGVRRPWAVDAPAVLGAEFMPERAAAGAR